MLSNWWARGGHARESYRASLFQVANVQNYVFKNSPSSCMNVCVYTNKIFHEIGLNDPNYGYIFYILKYRWSFSKILEV